MKQRQAPNGAPAAFVAAALDGTAPREPNGCILWPYAKHSAGYARIHQGPRLVPVAAVVLEHVVGPKPGPEYSAGHAPHDICGNRGCIAPEHLSWQTWDEQAANRIVDGTQITPTGPRGEGHQSATVSDAGVAAAIERVRAGETRAAVARDLGVSKVTVANWVRGSFRAVRT